MLFNSNKADCCGCSACASACPKHCIEMISDEEGFLYPNIQNELCVNCGMCEKVCPIIRAKKEKTYNEIKKAYIVQNQNSDVLKESTSGGFFSALAEYVILKGGIVFGAAYDENFEIKHIAIESTNQIDVFRNSKYTQSNINDSFRACKKELQTGRLVCFSGTACQIAGLASFLGEKYENLLNVDVVCRGVPSPLLFEKYVEWGGGKDKIQTIKFRDKHYGYFCSMMSVYYKDGSVQRREIHSDPMLKFFFQNMCSRPSCHECAFKTRDRVSDYTMFDCWHANKLSEGFGSTGATALIVRSSLAEHVWNEISNDNFRFAQVDFENLIELDGKMMISCVPPNIKRTTFFKALNEITFDEVIKMYSTESLREKIKIFIKKWLIRTGVFEKYMERKLRQ